MLSDFELNIYKALDELVGSEKKFKILETEDILNTTKKFDTTADIPKRYKPRKYIPKQVKLNSID